MKCEECKYTLELAICYRCDESYLVWHGAGCSKREPHVHLEDRRCR